MLCWRKKPGRRMYCYQPLPKRRSCKLNYPDILPQKENASQWCGGIGKEDVDYARDRIQKINAKIKEALNANVAKLSDNDKNRLKLVDIENEFGNNALCPSKDELALANGIKETNFDIEARRLLNLDGNGDAQARALVDNLSNSYQAYRQCLIRSLASTMYCDVDAGLQEVNSDAKALVKYIIDTDNGNSNLKIIIGNMAKPADSGEDKFIRYDRSFGFFPSQCQGSQHYGV